MNALVTENPESAGGGSPVVYFQADVHRLVGCHQWLLNEHGFLYVTQCSF